MTDFIRRRPLVSAIVAVLLLVLLLSSFPIVPETKQAVVVRFGKPERILNRFEPGRPIGAAGAGLSYRIPFIDQIVWIDKRVLAVDMEPQPVLSTDQRRLMVDAFARYRIVDPLLMYIRSRSEENLRSQLQTILRSEVRNELAQQQFVALLSPERQGVMDDVGKSLNVQAAKFGVEIIDVRIKKTDLPDGTPLQSAFESMRTARLQEARSIRAQGAKQAQIIRAQADADASKTYAASFGKDPQFYDFYRAMQSYQTTFVGDGQDKPAPTNIILSPQNDYLKEFSGRTK
ncbi:protease modulator HflC [Sphingomonas segetis]|uniref:protease modulator HflC n=1 Tax=Sphingomonas segetis TaxID=1104779 RepID=UPI0012D3615E|nr:protease modulator HflC [Sphingomonas segetis]